MNAKHTICLQDEEHKTVYLFLLKKIFHVFQISLEEYSPLSSMADRSISGRMSTISNAMSEMEPTGPPDRTYKIVFAGDAAVGKTCFIHRFCKGFFVVNLGSTLGKYIGIY